LDFSLETIGFDMGEIDTILEGAAPGRDVSQDPADSIPEKLRVRSQVSEIYGCSGEIGFFAAMPWILLSIPG